MKERKYYELIIYLYEHCDMVSFLVPDFDYAEEIDYGKRINRIMECFKPHILKNYESEEYCGRLTLGTYNIYSVAFHEDIIAPLCMGRGLYTWMYPELPEDLCFYKEGKCFLKSIAHEKTCWIYTDDETEIKTLKKMGLKFIDLPVKEAPDL